MGIDPMYAIKAATYWPAVAMKVDKDTILPTLTIIIPRNKPPKNPANEVSVQSVFLQGSLL
jgi:hypothetical protein